MPEQIYLSRRNLMMLLSKLDRQAAGESTSCTVIKYQNKSDPYVQSMDAIAVTAIEDDKFYANRNPGAMHPNDEVAVATKLYGDLMAIDESPSRTNGIVTINLGLLPMDHKNPVYTGYEIGQAAREILKMNELDEQDVLINVEVPDNTYSVSDSFWRGLLDDSLNKCGDKESAERKLSCGGLQVFQASFYAYIVRHFIARKLKS